MVEGACLASYGAEVNSTVCCGQNGTVPSVDYICPRDLPYCVDFVKGDRWGQCQRKEGKIVCPRGYKCSEGSLWNKKHKKDGRFIILSIATVLAFFTSLPFALGSSSGEKTKENSVLGAADAGGGDAKGGGGQREETSGAMCAAGDANAGEQGAAEGQQEQPAQTA